MVSGQSPAQPIAPVANGAPSWANRLRPLLPEFVVTLLLVLAFIGGSLATPYFLDSNFLIKQAMLYVEIGMLALGLTLIIISGNLDLSVAANLAMVSCVMAYLHAKMGISFPIALLLGVGLGVLGGLFNGVLVTRFGLPSLTVTLGTLALFRGIAQILVGDHSIQDFPAYFLGIDRTMLPGTSIPIPFVIFGVTALLLGILLHSTAFGRWLYAMGTNERAAHFAGVPTKRVKLIIFTLAGLLSSVAALMLTSRLLVARYDHARGWELDAITAVVLGGTSIAGGRGTIYGTVVALLLIAVLRTAMGVANVKVEAQLAVVGALLVIAVIVSNLLSRKRR
jgi:rhamnose transport system permease protein